MDSLDFSKLTHPRLPFFAILETDLRLTMRSWLVRIWLVLIGAQTLFFIAVSSDSGMTKYEGLAALLGTFPLLWSTIIIVFSGGAVSSESGVVADSILSKAIRRRDYILAKLAARVGVVVGLFLLATIPAALILIQNARGPMDTIGFLWAYTLIGLMLILITSLAVSFSTLFDRTLVAVIVVWFVWYMAGTVTALFKAEYLSPLAIVDSLPSLIQGEYKTTTVLRSVIGYLVMASGAIGVALLHFTRKDV